MKSRLAVAGLVVVLVVGFRGVTDAQTTFYQPSGFGGYTSFGQDGSVTTISRWLGGFLVNKTPSLFRGADQKSVLFEADEFSARFAEEAWLGAVEIRDVSAMTEAAWLLKGVETVLGKQDKKTTSLMMFDTAAQVAVAQGNADALKGIVALSDACKKYQDDMKAAGVARGAKQAVVAMPQLVSSAAVIAGQDTIASLDKFAAGLTPYQTPVLTPALIQAVFSGISTPEAENVAFLANRGRVSNDPRLLAQAAVFLSGKKAVKEFVFLKPGDMMDEAAELAVLMGDKNALSQIVDTYNNDNLGFKSADKVKEYGEEMKAMGATRGIPGCTLGDLMRPWYILINNPPPSVIGINRVM